jgi:hypothetical protein
VSRSIFPRRRTPSSFQALALAIKPGGALGFRMVPRVIPCPAEFAVENRLVAGSVGVGADGTISCAWIEHRRVDAYSRSPADGP